MRRRNGPDALLIALASSCILDGREAQLPGACHPLVRTGVDPPLSPTFLRENEAGEAGMTAENWDGACVRGTVIFPAVMLPSSCGGRQRLAAVEHRRSDLDCGEHPNQALSINDQKANVSKRFMWNNHPCQTCMMGATPDPR